MAPEAGLTLAQWLEQHCAATCDGTGNPVSQLPGLLAAALESYMSDNAATEAAAELLLHPLFRAKQPPPTKLHGSRTPAISIQAYAARLMKYCGCSPVCFIAAYAYVLRLSGAAARGSPAGVAITPRTAHRLFITGTVLAIKMLEDKYYSNSHYAQVGGVTIAEMNEMEMDMLQRLGYRARVDVPELCAALQEAHVRARRPCIPPPPAVLLGGVTAVAAAPAPLPALHVPAQLGLQPLALQQLHPFCQAQLPVEPAAMAVEPTVAAAATRADSDSCSTAAGITWGSVEGAATAPAVGEPRPHGSAPPSRAATAASASSGGLAWWDSGDITSPAGDAPGAGVGTAPAELQHRETPRRPLKRYSDPDLNQQCCRLEQLQSGAAAQAEREHAARRPVLVDA